MSDKIHTLEFNRTEHVKLYSWGKPCPTREEAELMRSLLRKKDPFLEVMIVPKKSGYRVYAGYAGV
jgi:hypothetical protein